MLPAVAQGAVGIESRADDFATMRLIAPINHQPTGLTVAAERAFSPSSMGPAAPDCRPRRVDGRDFYFRGMILTPDGAVA
jgi:hydroxymethylbilane synthase